MEDLKMKNLVKAAIYIGVTVIGVRMIGYVVKGAKEGIDEAKKENEDNTKKKD